MTGAVGAAGTEHPPCVDLGRIADATGGDREFLRQLVAVFLEDTDLRMSELDRAMGQRDLEALARTAHQLKGSSANLGATAFCELARSLEEVVAAERLDEADRLLVSLRDELGRLRPRLHELSGA
jgi:HPt (histidine-containing phosphotransfer) domain-containing protein